MMIDCVGGHGFALQLFNSLPHALHHHRHHHGSDCELIRRTHVWCDDSDFVCVCVFFKRDHSSVLASLANITWTPKSDTL